MRIGKLHLAALEATLRLYRDPERARREVPVLAMLDASEEELAARAERLAAAARAAGARAVIVRSVAKVGGGALPLLELEGPAVAVEPAEAGVDALAARLRAGDPPVIGRISEGRIAARSAYPHRRGGGGCRRRRRVRVACLMTPRTIRNGILLCLALALASPASAIALPTGFQSTNAFSGLDLPMAVRFAPNGHVFVAEKSGMIKAFSGLSDTTPTTVADLRTETYNYWDRGMMGLAVDPGYPSSPYIYVIYARNADIGGSAPKWVDPNNPDPTDDPCPDPPGDTDQGCVTSGRVARLEVNPATDQIVGSPLPLVDGWCRAVPQPLGGRSALRPERRAVRVGGRRAPTSTTRTTGRPATRAATLPPGRRPR